MYKGPKQPRQVKIIRDIRKLFEPEREKDYYKPVIGGDFNKKNYIEHKSKKVKFDEIKPYLKDIINILEESDTWKIQLIIAINFISSKDSDVMSVMHSKRDNIEIMKYDRADKVIEELFESAVYRYQIGLEISMRRSDFIFD